jgi:NAD(P)-dependent dehydrogenase (short-subunit alcohol dehydrogenase family)
MINDFEEEEELKHTAKEISKIIDNDNSNNSKVAYVVGDVSEEQTAVALIEETVRRFGRIDALIIMQQYLKKRHYKEDDI